MNIPFLDLKASGAAIEAQLIAAATDVITSGRYLRGEQTAALERDVARLCETRHCVAVSNGLDALRLVLRAWIELGLLHHGDKVAVQANTYVASVLAISDMGLVPVLVEPSLQTMNIDTDALREAVEHDKGIRAVMPVHLYGSPCWDTTLLDVVEQHGLLVLEDNAQAINATSPHIGINGKFKTGSLGNAAACSFYPTKNLGALGDAGAVTTDDTTLADTVRALANYGSDRRYHNIYKGYNCRIDEIQAAMLRVKIKHLETETTRRQLIATTYDEHISNPVVTRPLINNNRGQVWHQYVIRVRCGARDRLREYLAGAGVGTDIHYAVPPHRQPCYAGAFNNISLPLTEQLASEVVSLPIAAPLTVTQATEIADLINRFDAV